MANLREAKMDNEVCGYTNWDTFVVGLWADNTESLYTQLWDILQEYGDTPTEARPILLDFYQNTVFPVAQKGEAEKVDFDAVNWHEVIDENLAQWQEEKHYYQEG